MKLRISSHKNDVLELEINNCRPMLQIGELVVNGESEVWHGRWKNLFIREFLEDYSIAKEKIVNFYHAEKENSKDGKATIRRPGRAELIRKEEKWDLANCKILNCIISDADKKIVLEIAYDGVYYHDLKSK